MRFADDTSELRQCQWENYEMLRVMNVETNGFDVLRGFQRMRGVREP